MDKGTPIRAVSRAFDVLQCINRMDAPTLTDISKETGLPYPSVFRLAQTLTFLGLIEAEPSRKRYRPTALVHTLSQGYQRDDALTSHARSHIVGLTETIGWPVSIVVRVGNRMMVKDSTHALTTLTLNNYYPGHNLPLMECATGRAYVAFCPEEELNVLTRSLREVETQENSQNLTLIEATDFVQRTRADGYATYARNAHTANPGKTSSVAVPIFDAQGEGVKACLVITFFSSAIKMQEAVDRFVPQLQQCSAAISQTLQTAEDAPSVPLP